MTSGILEGISYSRPYQNLRLQHIHLHRCVPSLQLHHTPSHRDRHLHRGNTCFLSDPLSHCRFRNLQASDQEHEHCHHQVRKGKEWTRHHWVCFSIKATDAAVGKIKFILCTGYSNIKKTALFLKLGFCFSVARENA